MEIGGRVRNAVQSESTAIKTMEELALMIYFEVS